MKWFKHDTDASIDAKLQELLLDYGASGYGLYWYCVELIAQNVTENNITFELEHDARIIARNLNLTPKETEDMMRKMIDLGLFSIGTNKKLACYTLAKRIDQSMTSSKHFRGIIKDFKEQNHDEVMISHDKVMQDKIRLDKIRLDKTSTEEKKQNPFDIFTKQLNDLFKQNKISTFKDKINATKETKENLELISVEDLSKVADSYVNYVKTNKSKSVRLDKYLLAYHEGNINAIQYGIEKQTPIRQQNNTMDTIDRVFAKQNAENNIDTIDAEVV